MKPPFRQLWSHHLGSYEATIQAAMKSPFRQLWSHHSGSYEATIQAAMKPPFRQLWSHHSGSYEVANMSFIWDMNIGFVIFLCCPPFKKVGQTNTGSAIILSLVKTSFTRLYSSWMKSLFLFSSTFFVSRYVPPKRSQLVRSLDTSLT